MAGRPGAREGRPSRLAGWHIFLGGIALSTGGSAIERGVPRVPERYFRRRGDAVPWIRLNDRARRQVRKSGHDVLDPAEKRSMSTEGPFAGSSREALPSRRGRTGRGVPGSLRPPKGHRDAAEPRPRDRGDTGMRTWTRDSSVLCGDRGAGRVRLAPGTIPGGTGPGERDPGDLPHARKERLLPSAGPARRDRTAPTPYLDPGRPRRVPARAPIGRRVLSGPSARCGRDSDPRRVAPPLHRHEHGHRLGRGGAGPGSASARRR